MSKFAVDEVKNHQNPHHLTEPKVLITGYLLTTESTKAN